MSYNLMKKEEDIFSQRQIRDYWTMCVCVIAVIAIYE